jgi:hypothetical protein
LSGVDVEFEEKRGKKKEMVVDIKLEACLVQTLPHRRESVETFQTPP